MVSGGAEEAKEGLRPYVGLKKGYAALCPYHLLGRRELSCERVGRRNGRRTDACMRKCEIPRPKDLCAGGIGGRDESESETNTSGVPPVRGVRVRGPAGLPAHIIMHLCEPLSSAAALAVQRPRPQASTTYFGSHRNFEDFQICIFHTFRDHTPRRNH